jgi:hypothetical protein
MVHRTVPDRMPVFPAPELPEKACLAAVDTVTLPRFEMDTHAGADVPLSSIRIPVVSSEAVGRYDAAMVPDIVMILAEFAAADIVGSLMYTTSPSLVRFTL